jgi:hypothetical protein
LAWSPLELTRGRLEGSFRGQRACAQKRGNTGVRRGRDLEREFRSDSRFLLEGHAQDRTRAALDQNLVLRFRRP